MSYLNNYHPVIKQDYDCAVCALGKNRIRHNKEHAEEDNFRPQSCIGGAGPEDLTEVRLIVISDYPGHYETLHDEPMHDISRDREARKKGLLQSVNAGALLRMTLNLMYGLDTYEDCWITNAIKCNPNQLKAQENPHLRPCIAQWLNSELLTLSDYVPSAPILVAGKMAFKGVCRLYAAKQLEDIGLNNCRRRTDLKLGEHPLVVTFNPAIAARSMPKIETKVSEKKGYTFVNENEWLFPLLPGSPMDNFIKDLHPLAPYLTS